MYDNTPPLEIYTDRLPDKAAPGVFETISMELESLLCVLDEAAETQLSHPLTPQRAARLNTILAGFSSVLRDLQYVVGKYQSLGTNDKSAWDQLKFGNEDIAEIRSRLVMNMSFLTTFRRFDFWPTYPSTSLTRLMPVLLLEPRHLKEKPHQDESLVLGSGWSSSQPRDRSLQQGRTRSL